MRRALVIVAASLAGLIILAGAGLLALFYTEPGRAFIALRIEPALGDALGGTARIGRLSGRLPGNIVLADVEVAAEGEVWLTVGRLEMDWSPIAAISGRIDIARLDLERIRLRAAPPDSPDDDSDDALRAPRLPTALPRIAIERVEITDASVAEHVFGRPLRMDGAGRLVMGGRALSLRLEASSAEETDLVSIGVELDPDADHGELDLLVASTADGFIAGIAGVDGPLYVEGQGDAPLSDFSARMDGVVGALGSLDLVLAADLLEGRALRVEGGVLLGDRLDDIAEELGPEIALALELAQDESSTRLIIQHVQTGAGRIAGDLVWRGGRNGAQALDGRLRAVFAEGYRADIQELIGGEASADFSLARAEEDYRLDLELNTPRARLVLDRARTDLDSRIAGLARVEVAEGALPAPLDAGAVAEGQIDVRREGPSSVEELELATPDGSAFQGEVRYDPSRNAAAFGGTLSLSPAMLADAVSGLTAESGLRAEISASGTLPRLAGQAEIDSPALSYNDGRAPAARATLQFELDADEARVDLSARPREGEGRLRLRAARASDGAVDASEILLEGAGFRLAGSGAWLVETETLRADLAYEGDEGAEPFPGVPLSGEFSVRGAIGRQKEASDLVLTAANLQSGDMRVASLEARAQGPSNNVRFTASGEDLDLSDAGRIDSLALAGAADLGEPLTITLTELDALTRGVNARLQSPMRIRTGDGVEIENARLSLGEDGALALDGAFSQNRWRANMTVRDAPVPAADGYVSFRLDLDTDRETPARGEFEARSPVAPDYDASIAGRFVWDGETVRLTDDPDNESIDMDIRAPLRLTRAPAVSIDAEGPLSGRIRYDGRIEALAPLLPTSLQTLEGALAAEATVEGTLDNPAVSGRLTLSEGAYTELASDIGLENIEGEATAAPGGGDGTLIRFDFSARGPGQNAQTVFLSGQATLGEDARMDGVLRLDGARLSAGPVRSTTGSGEVSLTGPLDAIDARGALTVSELNAEIVTPETGGLVEIEVVPIDGETEEAAGPESPAPPPLRLNVEISANDRLFVRGRGLESEWGADMRIAGDAREPVATGAISLRRGYLDFAGRRFRLTRGEIAFDRLSRNDPTLDIRAEHQTNGVMAAIEITGRASSPSVNLVSTPSMPTNDVMALILFGKPATELSALESLQVAQAIAEIGGIGPFGGTGGGLTGAARRALGVDLLNVDIEGDTGASTLEVGKYVAEGLFVSAIQDIRGESGAVRVEYEITPSITVETELRQNGDQTVSANWKRDF